MIPFVCQVPFSVLHLHHPIFLKTGHCDHGPCFTENDTRAQTVSHMPRVTQLWQSHLALLSHCSPAFGPFPGLQRVVHLKGGAVHPKPLQSSSCLGRASLISPSSALLGGEVGWLWAECWSLPSPKRWGRTSRENGSKHLPSISNHAVGFTSWMMWGKLPTSPSLSIFSSKWR